MFSSTVKGIFFLNTQLVLTMFEKIVPEREREKNSSAVSEVMTGATAGR